MTCVVYFLIVMYNQCRSYITFCLLPDKKKESYQCMFSLLKWAMEWLGLELSVSYFMSDFENWWGIYCPNHHPSNSKLWAGQGAPEGGRQGEWWKNICHKNKILYEAKCLKCPDSKYIGESDRNLFTWGGEHVRNKSGFIAKHQEEKHNSEQAEFKCWTNPCVVAI